jgi:hypothetical protein
VFILVSVYRIVAGSKNIGLKCCGWPDVVLVLQNRCWKVVVNTNVKGRKLIVPTECIASIKADVLCISVPASVLNGNIDQSLGGRNLKAFVCVTCIG